MTHSLTLNNRRAFLKLASHSALLISLGGISACSKQEPVATSAPDASTAAAPEPAAASAPAAATGNLPHLDPADPIATSLGYHEDASTIDAAKYPQHAKGQACRKCVQFKGGAADPWGPCTIFTGRQVNANGWCTAFAAKT